MQIGVAPAGLSRNKQNSNEHSAMTGIQLSLTNCYAY
jgi:hypothetical protein